MRISSSTSPLSPVKKEYPLRRTPKSGKIKVILSPNPKKTSGVIYRFKHKKSGKKYVGSVAETARGNNTARRISRYHSEFNRDGVKKRRHIANAIRLDPDAFTFGIYEQLPSGSSEKELHEVENQWQERYDTRDRAKGYNQSDPRNEPLRAKPLFPSDSEEPSKSE